MRTHGQLACETCGFDFKAMCGPHGDGYIECHHVIPLHASGETKTRLDDLILICSNCHRMIHRRTGVVWLGMVAWDLLGVWACNRVAGLLRRRRVRLGTRVC